ncbi:glycosyltransferase [Paracoccaceae bacterium GXU_MW_L88]
MDLAFDITRMISRRHLGGTSGIDRVDRAYFAFVREEGGIFVAKLGGQMRVLSRDGAEHALALPPRSNNGVSARVAEGRALMRLSQRWKGQAIYLNTSHSNPGPRHLHAMKKRGCRILFLIHDLLPLSHPEYFRSETRRSFDSFATHVAGYADIVLANSSDTAQQWSGFFPQAPKAHVVPLGTEPLPEVTPDPEAEPYFLMLGTVEPRKNHAFALDVWERLGAQAPRLHVVGRPGWAAPDLFARLDAAVNVTWHQKMDDAALAKLLGGARALLFPSHAEGYGYPPVEAAMLGTPTVSAPLPTVREALGAAVMQLPLDENLWAAEALRRSQDTFPEFLRRRHVFLNYNPPSWREHFNLLNECIVKNHCG